MATTAEGGGMEVENTMLLGEMENNDGGSGDNHTKMIDTGEKMTATTTEEEDDRLDFNNNQPAQEENLAVLQRRWADEILEMERQQALEGLERAPGGFNRFVPDELPLTLKTGGLLREGNKIEMREGKTIFTI